MATVYLLREDDRTEPMKRIYCKSEDKELQSILEQNPNLLPGDQINPEDPRRWLLIKREMAVASPTTGSDLWSLDFLFCDQDAIPTMVECKRFADTRARREIVGQMLEYAANGAYYWTPEVLQGSASEAAGGLDALEEAFQKLHPNSEESVDAFFQRVQENLREGQIRIIFFLDDSSNELRSIVDFLNRQMERSEVLLVEARQYSHSTLPGHRFVAPSLFGYTEEARRVKRSVTVKTAVTQVRKHWDQESYFADAEKRLSSGHLDAVRTLFERSQKLSCKVDWGRGATKGSFNVKEPTACPKSLLTVYSDGGLTLNFSWLNGSEAADWARHRMKELLGEAGIPVMGGDADKSFKVESWADKVQAIGNALDKLVVESRARSKPVAPEPE